MYSCKTCHSIVNNLMKLHSNALCFDDIGPIKNWKLTLMPPLDIFCRFVIFISLSKWGRKIKILTSWVVQRYVEYLLLSNIILERKIYFILWHNPAIKSCAVFNEFVYWYHEPNISQTNAKYNFCGWTVHYPHRQLLFVQFTF